MEDESPIRLATGMRSGEPGVIAPARGPAPKRTPTQGTPAVPAQVPPAQVTFDRRELDRILNLYGRMVAQGEWRDYAIDFLRDKAVFSIFRRAMDVPVYRIEKDPRLARKQGAYSVVSQTGLILKRGHELQRVLAVLEKPLRPV